jgi:hypothetical protein
MLSKLKNKMKSIFKKKFDIKRSKSFDIDAHLEELEFYKDFENDSFCYYVKECYSLCLNKNMKTFYISNNGIILSKLNFIPSSSMVLSMVVKLTLKQFETAAEEKQN